MINNPRFPHTCKISRTQTVTTQYYDHLSVAGDGEWQEEGDWEEPDKWKMTPSIESDDPNVDDDDTRTSEIICYDGKCRSYDKDVTSDRGDVLTQRRVLALPIKQDEWSETDVPRKGDKVEVNKGSFNEWGVVIDIRPNNLGTDVLWRYND